jgi:hypothetical protein
MYFDKSARSRIALTVVIERQGMMQRTGVITRMFGKKTLVELAIE